MVLAESGHTVTGVDVKPRLIQEITRGETNIHEPGLRELLRKNLQNGSFKATLNIDEAVRESEAIFVTVGTPMSSDKKIEFEQLISSIKSIGRNLEKGHIVVIKSTVPPGTTQTIVKPILERESNLKAGKDFFLAFAPERVVEGNALREFRLVPKIVGGIDEESAKRAAQILKSLGGDIIIVSSPKVAEAAKLFDNIYRSVNIALGNELGIACERLGIDMHEACEAANKNYPRNRILPPGPGVGGYCLKKDPKMFCFELEKLGYKPRLISLATKLNNEMPLKIVQMVQEVYESMKKSIHGSKVLILGLAYKGRPETDDVRNSPSKVVIEKLMTLGANPVGYDPVVPENKAEQLGVAKVSLEKGFKDSSCLVVMTNHPSFLELNLERLTKLMAKPAGIVDGWHIFNQRRVKQLGLHYRCLGTGQEDGTIT